MKSEVNTLKKSKKIIIAVLVVIAVVAAGAYGAYKLYFEPEVVDKTIIKVQEALNDDELKEEIDAFVQEMADSGILSDESLQNYVKMKEAENAAKSTGNQGGDSSQTGTQSQASPNGSQTQSEQTGTNPAGNNQTERPAESTSDSPVDRAKAAMTADEFAFAMSMYNKLDIGYITGNIHSHRKEVKEYVKNTLTGAEISRCLDIYTKYSYILQD